MPYTISQLIADKEPLVCVHLDDTVLDALDSMMKHDYSQLPVIDKEDRPLGMITYESIIRAIRSFDVKLDFLHVRDCVVDVPDQYIEDDYFDLFDKLLHSNAVLILDPGGLLINIITTFDTATFFRSRSEDFMRLEDIEYTLKELILKAYTSSEGEVDREKLSKAIERVGGARNDQKNSTKPKSFESLTLGEYFSLLTLNDTWDFFEPILKIKRNVIKPMCEQVKTTRNDLAHFRNEISLQARDQLRYFADWLISHVQEYEEVKKQEMIEMKRIKYANQITEKIPQNTHEKQNKKSQRKKINSRYCPLADWLAEKPDDQILLTLEEIEGIINSPLPMSARSHRAWWANDKAGHTHSRLWMNAGWRTTYINLQEGQIGFTREKSLDAEQIGNAND